MSIPIHISQYIQDSVSSNISQEERVARIRIITELVHDKIVRLFAASDITFDDLFANLFASAIPSAEEIDVELWAAPNGSYSLSVLFVKPDNPFPCLKVLILFFLPVRILCG